MTLFQRKALYKVKSVMQGERTLKQKDDDDDDDDDGGEYEGLDYNNAEDTGKKSSVNKCSGKQNNQGRISVAHHGIMFKITITFIL